MFIDMSLKKCPHIDTCRHLLKVNTVYYSKSNVDCEVKHLELGAISGLSSSDVGNPYIVYGEQRDDKPDIAGSDHFET